MLVKMNKKDVNCSNKYKHKYIIKLLTNTNY